MKSWTEDDRGTAPARFTYALNPDPLHVPEQFSAEIGTTEDHGAWFLHAILRGLLIAAFAGLLVGLVVGYVVGRLA